MLVIRTTDTDRTSLKCYKCLSILEMDLAESEPSSIAFSSLLRISNPLTPSHTVQSRKHWTLETQKPTRGFAWTSLSGHSHNRLHLSSSPPEIGSARFCAFHRKFNAAAVKDAYLTPWLQEWFASLAEDRIVLTFSTNLGYWQIEIDERYWNKTTFTLYHELYIFIRMQLSLKNASGPFQRAENVILSRVWWYFALAYPDHIAIFSK